MAIGFFYKCTAEDCGFTSHVYEEVRQHLEANHEHIIKASYIWVEDPPPEDPEGE